MDRKGRTCSCPLATAILMTALGFILVAFGLSSLALFPYIIDNQIRDKLPLKNTSSSGKNWEKPPVPVYMEFWYWNCTNPEEFIAGKEKANMTQIGPFVYLEIRDKRNLSFNANGTIFYREDKAYVFQPQLSNEQIDNEVNVINLPLLTVLAKLNGSISSSFLQIGVKTILEDIHINLFERHTIREFFWGYKIPIIDKLAEDIEKLIKKFPILKAFLKKFEEELKTMETFGIFYIGKAINGTDDGVYEIMSGTKNINEIGQYVTYNYNKYLPYWNTRYCNMLNGSDGSLYPPGVTKNSSPCVFTGDLGRSICTTYESETNLKGIKLYRFTAPFHTLGNITINPDNRCFCTPGCLDSGVLNISRVRAGAPLVVSQPHFFQASTKYIYGVNGMTPKSGEHQTFLEIEPNTGVSMNVAKKIQINAYLTKIGQYGILQTENIDTPVIFPLFWLNESAKADDKAINLMKQEAITPMKILGILRWFCIGLGCLFLLISCFIFFSLYIKRQDKYQNLIDDREVLTEEYADSTSIKSNEIET
ncbi:DgyrCDS10877 [Dimorphilus gyrociliatus]|uniref:DgyrCDS10877 n=1 Tax=Dimorphilus gyrociliatus TaxID=2664684 RepID=A0A7I8W1L2_9ANNE|nr:DgyrCDS10877 [Dimorphilus gyrociliatus]